MPVFFSAVLLFTIFVGIELAGFFFISDEACAVFLCFFPAKSWHGLIGIAENHFKSEFFQPGLKAPAQHSHRAVDLHSLFFQIHSRWRSFKNNFYLKSSQTKINKWNIYNNK